MDFRVYFIIEDIETSSGLFGITQAFTLLHVVRRQGGNLFKVRPHGRTFVRRCPRTKVRVRLTFTSYSYFCTMLKIFFPNSRTQHIISVVYENQCASDFSVKGWIFVQNIAFLFYIPS